MALTPHRVCVSDAHLVSLYDRRTFNLEDVSMRKDAPSKGAPSIDSVSVDSRPEVLVSTEPESTEPVPTESGSSEQSPAPARPVSTSTLRALQLLECFFETPVLSLAQLVRASGYSKTTTHRLATTLVEAGWLTRTLSGYQLGLKVFRLGQAAADAIDLRRAALPLMNRLAEETGDSVYLVVPDGHRAVCLERIDGPEALRVADLTVGGSQDLHLGAGPRALLAFDEERLLPVLLGHGLTRRTTVSLADEAALRADLAATRERGYAISRGDATAGVGALGVPVFDQGGSAVAALSVGGLLERVAPEREIELARLLLKAGSDLSRRLGRYTGE